jgi:polyphenol oxidase
VASAKTKAPKRAVSPAVPQWNELQSCDLRILQASALSQFSSLAHGFSTRLGGFSPLDGERVLNLGFAEWDSRENVLKNRKLLLRALAAREMSLLPLRQFHSDVVRAFESAPAESCRGDASLTNRPGLLLAIQTADCVPILLADARGHAVAAVHAGWRGTLQRIVQKTIGRMRMELGTRPEDLIAAIGPAIGGCCYEVGTEVSQAFQAQFPDAAKWFDELRTGDEPNPLQWLNMMPPGHQPSPKNVRLDLRAANRAQLFEAGVSAQSISVSNLCTRCRSDLFFSYRGQGPRSGRLMSVIGLRPA